MSRRLLKIVLPIVVVIIGGVAARAIIASKPEPERQERPESRPLVEVMTATRVDHRYVVRAQGTVEPRTSSSLMAEVMGRVLEISDDFVEGGFFERGDVLLVLDDRDYRAAAAQARAQVATARLLLEREQEEARVASEEWERFEHEGEPTALVLREPQLAQARANLEAAEAQLERAERDLERTRVRAPYAGRVRTKRVDVGDFVQPGTPAAQIYAVDYAEVRLPLPDKEIAYLELPLDLRGAAIGNERGPRVLLHGLFAGRTHTWRGYVQRTEGEIDPRTRMVHVVVRVSDPYGGGAAGGEVPLSVGMFVEAEIEGRRVEDVVVLPRRALLEGEHVGVIDEDDHLRLVPVDVLRATTDEVVVGGGLMGGERVLLDRLEVMVDGMSVRVSERSPRPGAAPSATTTADSATGGGAR